MPVPVINEVVSDYENELMSSRTYRLDLDTKRITGFIDGVEAIRQAVYKVLDTERASFAIYSTPEGLNYGGEIERFIGKSFGFIKSDMERTVTDALSQDERILGVKDFVVSDPVGDSLTVSLTVSSIFGDIYISREARIK